VAFINPYDYKPIRRCTVIPLKTNSCFSRFAVTFPSAVKGKHSTIDNVTGVYYSPKNTSKSPLVVLVHGIGDSSTVPCHALARSLVKIGVASFVIYLPIHSRRLPQDMKQRFYNLSLEEWFELYRVSVINIRQALDWAESRPEIDRSRLGVTGISFGGYVAGIALGLDDRLKAGAILLACGNQEKLGWTRSTRRIPKYNVSESVYREGQNRYLNYVNEVSAKGFENVDPPRSSYTFDPYTFCSTIKSKRLLLINAFWDEYFPREAAKEFAGACGSPDQLWLPAGHATAWLFYPLIRQRVIKLFRRAFITQTSG
jgi:hypothetical protein